MRQVKRICVVCLRSSFLHNLLNAALHGYGKRELRWHWRKKRNMVAVVSRKPLKYRRAVSRISLAPKFLRMNYLNGSVQFARSLREYPLENAQECHQVRLLLRRQDQSKALFVKVHNIHQGLRRTVMEVRRVRGKAAQDWSLDLANMVESSVD